MEEGDFWPNKTLYGLQHEMQQESAAVPYDQMMENLDVYGESLFLQAKEIQGADSFCDNDASLMFHPGLDLPFEQIPIMEKSFRNRDYDTYKAHPHLKEIMQSYEEGRQNGLITGIEFNIPLTDVDSKDYFGNKRQQNVLCGMDYGESLRIAAELATKDYQQSQIAAVRNAQQPRTITRTPSSLADRTPPY